MSPPTLAYRRPSDAACEVLGRALDVILADPDGWEQDVYGRRTPCGTAFCLAGHVDVTVLGYGALWCERHDGSASLAAVEVPGRGTVTPDVAAAEALELTSSGYVLGGARVPDARATRLFAAATSLRRLLDLAFLYTDGRVDRFAAYDRLVAAGHAVVARDADLEAVQRDGVVELVRFYREDDHPGFAPERRDRDYWECMLA